MRTALRYSLAGFIGAVAGWLCWVFIGNMEDRPFYTIRSWATGKTIPREISEHPADWWIWIAFFATLVAAGAIVGVLVAIATKGKPS